MNSGHKGKKHYMSSGHNTGKKDIALKVVENALAKCEEKLKQNPLAILVKAIENAAPREEVIAIEYGGARYPKAVDVAPQRRIDLAFCSDNPFKIPSALTKACSISASNPKSLTLVCSPMWSDTFIT